MNTMSFPKKYLILFIAFSVLKFTSCARILAYYPIPFHSHQSVFNILTEELARQGHELVVLAPNPHSKPLENVTQIDVTEVSYRIWEEGFKEKTKNLQFAVGPTEMFKIAYPLLSEIVSVQISAPEMQAIIQDETQRFDVILIEACLPISVILAARFKAPIVQVSSFLGDEASYRELGAVIHPLIFPEFYMQKTLNLSFWDKISELKTYLTFKYYERKWKVDDNNLIKRYFGADAPTVEELRKNINMLLINAHHIWDNNRPVPPSVVYMGALHLKKPKPIPKDLQHYLDSSKNGVIYMSLGSKILFSDLHPATLRVFLKVFSSLPYDVLIKWNGGALPEKPANVRLEKWLPQNDMLRHPKIKGFIMQGGLQSTDEAIAANVPLIALPVFGDQWFNAQKFVQLGIGRELDINNLEENDLLEAIKAITEDKSYRENIVRLSRFLEERQAGGLEKAVYWIDYVAKHGAHHLRSPLADASLVDIFLLDILGAAALLTIIVGYLTFVLGRIVVRYVVSQVNIQKKLKLS